MERYRNLATLLGRLLLSVIFIPSGFGKLTNLARTGAMMAQAGIPHLLVYPGLVLSIAVELGLGLLLIIGFRARIAALLIFLWMIPVTILFHFLPYREAIAQGNAMAAMAQQANFMKNLSIMGGLLMVVGLGSGAWSADGGR